MRESIIAGARYIDLLKDMLPEEVREPDRTWLALASYNIGPGQFQRRAAIGELMRANPNGMVRDEAHTAAAGPAEILRKVKSGRARGGEAVLLVENIRAYNDILARQSTALPDCFGEDGEHDRHVGQHGRG